jgi:hypothetical protein
MLDVTAGCARRSEEGTRSVARAIAALFAVAIAVAAIGCGSRGAPASAHGMSFLPGPVSSVGVSVPSGAGTGTVTGTATTGGTVTGTATTGSTVTGTATTGGTVTGTATTGGTVTGTATTGGTVTGTATTGGTVTGTATAGGTVTGTATTGGTVTATATVYYLEDFDGPAPQVALSTGTPGAWTIGAPRVGPGAAHSGPSCLAVNLAAPGYPGGLVADAATTPFSLAGATHPVLRIFHAYDIATASLAATGDGGRVLVQSASVGVRTVDPYLGYPCFVVDRTGDVGFAGDTVGAAGGPPQWIEDRFDLTPFAGQAAVQVIFDFESGTGSSGTHAGWFVDDVEVVEAAQLPGGLAGAPGAAIFGEAFDGAAPQLAPSPGSSWQIGAPPPFTGIPPNNFGPGGPFSAPNAAGTNMTSAAPAPSVGRYPDGVGGGGGIFSGSGPGDILATTATITIPATATAATLFFEQYFDFEERYDGCRVVVTADKKYGIWVPVEPRGGYPLTPIAFSNFQWPNAAFTGSTQGWHRCSIDLMPATRDRLVGSTFYLGFEFATDPDNVVMHSGWYIDEIEVVVR